MRYLRDCEKKNICENDKLVWFFAKNINSYKKLILSIVIFIVIESFSMMFLNVNKIICIVLMIIYIICSILLYIGTKVLRDINNNKIWCEDVKLIDKRSEKKVSIFDANEYEYFYVTIEFREEKKEIQYNGKEFGKLKEGDKIVLIEYMFFNKKMYMCFSYDEINKI